MTNLLVIVFLAGAFVGGMGVGILCRKRWARVAGVGAVVVVVSVCAHFLWQTHRWQRGLETIHLGDTREKVCRLMGTPTLATDETCGIYGSKREAKDRVPGCKEQYWYYAFFTPECWWIAFDQQGHVIKSYHYVSP